MGESNPARVRLKDEFRVPLEQVKRVGDEKSVARALCSPPQAGNATARNAQHLRAQSQAIQ